MTPRVLIVLLIYASVSIVAAVIYPLIPGSLPAELRLVILSLLGPNLALFTHMFVLAYGLATATTLPWFLVYAAKRRIWLMGTGLVVWLVWGSIFSYTLVAPG